MDKLEAPFTYFGGKRDVAAEVWRRFGSVRSYVEPFFGSGAVLLGRPQPFSGAEIVNDKDALLCNFWRALQADPNAVARHADWPVNECDLHARHLWLVEHKEDITDRLILDPEWYDVKAAGWWVWGASSWIGQGWCSGNGSWVRVEEGLGKSDLHTQGISKAIPKLSGFSGVNRSSIQEFEGGVAGYFRWLAHRLRRVIVCTGDWSRITGDSATTGYGLCGVFLDPPYDVGDMNYGSGGMGEGLASDVRKWAIEAGKISDMRIALCGYEEHNDLAQHGWDAYRWKARGGFSNQNKREKNGNNNKEVIWFSPHCLKPEESVFDLFGNDEGGCSIE